MRNAISSDCEDVVVGESGVVEDHPSSIAVLSNADVLIDAVSTCFLLEARDALGTSINSVNAERIRSLANCRRCFVIGD